MKLHPMNVKSFVSLEETVLAQAEAKVSAVALMLERCDSPLEQKFLLDWLSYTGHEFRHWVNDDATPFLFFDNDTDGTVRLASQVPVAAGGRSFRLDFLFTYISDGFTPTEVVNLNVEIDGHQYHERTPEQAVRDRSRDRILSGAGYTVFRFTGAEIYAPFRPMTSPVSEVSSLLHQYERRVAESKGLLTPRTYSDDSWRDR